MLLVNYKPLLSGHKLSGIAGSAWLAPLMTSFVFPASSAVRFSFLLLLMRSLTAIAIEP